MNKLLCQNNKDDPEWKDFASHKLGQHLKQQLEKLPNDVSLNKIALNARFGVFYVTEVALTLKETSSSILHFMAIGKEDPQ